MSDPSTDVNERYGVYQNSKTRIENIEISCYGETMIMVEHYALPAPRPLGPSLTEHRSAEGITGFWDKTPRQRTRAVIEHLDKSVDWKESSPDLMLSLGEDIAKALDRLEKGSKEDTDTGR